MKRIKWKLLFSSLFIIFLFLNYANCEKSQPGSSLDLNKHSLSSSNLNKGLLDNNSETNNEEDDDEDGKDMVEDDEEENDDEKTNVDKENTLDNNEDKEENNEDENDSLNENESLNPVTNNKPKNKVLTNKNKNEPNGFNESDENEEDNEDNDNNDEDKNADEENDKEDENEKDDTNLDNEQPNINLLPKINKEVTNDLNKETFNRDKKQPAIDINNVKPNKPNDFDEGDNEQEESELENESKPKSVLPDDILVMKEKRKELDSNQLPGNIDKSKESSVETDDQNNMENNIASLGRKDLSKGQISLFAQPIILAVVIGSAVAGLLISIVLVMIILYRLSSTKEENYYC